MKDEETEGDDEELVKQREHRAKAGRVLALLELEQKALETEEQEEKRWEQYGRQEEEQESSRRASAQSESPAIEMDEHEESEDDDDEGPIEWDRETVSSEKWAWAQLQTTISCYRSDMLALVTKFEEANRRVWREVIHRHKSSGSSGSSARDPLAPLVNNQMRGGAHDIQRLKSKRQHKLKECAKMQRQWHGIRAANAKK